MAGFTLSSRVPALRAWAVSDCAAVLAAAVDSGAVSLFPPQPASTSRAEAAAAMPRDFRLIFFIWVISLINECIWLFKFLFALHP